MIPFKTPWLLKKAFPSLIWDFSKTAEKEIYLTFDDGPIPGVTPFVLETLAKHNAKATFFCIGENVEKHPDIFKQIIDAGHPIGNHTFNHLNGKHTELNDYLENVKKCDEILESHGIKTRLFRPPYGRLKRSQRLALKHKSIVMWDVLTKDYNSSIKPEKCLQKSINAARNGSIVLFHDSLKAEKNMKYALSRFMEYCAEEGYLFREIEVC